MDTNADRPDTPVVGVGDKQPGKQSGVTADDLSQATDIGAVAPGRRNLTQSTEVGDQWIDHGAHCDGKTDTTPGCFLTDEVRLRLIVDFKSRVQTAQTNYKLALVELRVDELIKKDDDLNWVLSLVLDVAGAHAIGVAAKALTKVKASGLAKLNQFGLDAGSRGEFSDKSLSSRAEKLLGAVTDKRIESWSKSGFGALQKNATKGIQNRTNEDQKDETTAVLSFIDQLKDGCDVGFMNFASHASGSASDAELVVLWEGMHPTNHSVGLYKAALTEKIARFKRSGVNDIGRKQVNDRTFQQTSVHRDTRVVWVRNYPSDGKQLWYQSQEGDYDPGVVAPGDPGSDRFFPEYGKSAHTFGPSQPRENPVLDRVVPEEFREAALARSEQKWGATPTLDPVGDQWRGLGYDERKGTPPSSPSKPLSSPNATSQTNRPLPRLDLGATKPPDKPLQQPALPQDSVFNQPQPGLPADSVFARDPLDQGKS